MNFLVLLMALIHIYIFVLESIFWRKKRTARIFGMSPEKMEANRLLAFNQGFYNLFLAVALLAGLFLKLQDHVVEGSTLITYGALSVLGAGLVLLISSPKLYRPALVQMVPAFLLLVLQAFRF